MLSRDGRPSTTRQSPGAVCEPPDWYTDLIFPALATSGTRKVLEKPMRKEGNLEDVQQKPRSGESKPSHEGGQAQGYKDVLMKENVEDRRQPAKRRNNEIEGGPSEDPPKEQQQNEDLIAFLLKMLEQKDEQMKGMRKTIDALNERLGEMQETLDRMERQQPIAEQENL